MKKKKISRFIMTVFMLLLFIMGCSANGDQDEINDDIADVNISENLIDDLAEEELENPIESQPDSQAETPQSGQMEDREIVCENPYFFPQNISSMVAYMPYIHCWHMYSYYLNETWVELKLYWLKQYDNGCLAKLSIVPFSSDMPDYLDENRLNTYFYVTADEIYQVSPYIVQDDELITFYDDDTLLMSILNTDEKLIENGELVCCLEEVEDPLEEGKAGTHTSIARQENQISYSRVDIKQNGDRDYYEKFIWEEGKGLIGYMSGYGRGFLDENECVYLDDIIYGTTDQTEDREIICQNPYFFPQDVSLLTADLTYDLRDPIIDELELHWLKQYDDGCLARLSVVPFDDIPLYMNMGYFNMYFYVTSDEIYRVYFYVASVDGSFDNMNDYINYNDNLLMSVLNTDERLMEYGDLVFCLEGIEDELEEGEEGTHTTISQNGDQVIFDRYGLGGNENLGLYENYIWEYGQGLVERGRGRAAMADTLYIENIVAQ